MLSLGALAAKIPTPLKQAFKDRIYPDLLGEGETAPEWQLQSWDGQWHRLKKEWSILIFYPGDDTPGCTRQLQDFQEHYAQLQSLGCQVYAVNPAGTGSHQAFAEKFGFTFPILTDTDGAVARAFRCLVPFSPKPLVIRSVVLLNPERKIRLANRGAPSVAAIIRSIQALQQGTKEGM